MKHIILLALLSLIVLGCSDGQGKNASKETTQLGQATSGSTPDFQDDALFISGGVEKSDPKTPMGQTVASIRQFDLRKVVRNGSISVRVDDAQNAEKSVGDLLSTGPGYVETSNYSGHDSGSPCVKMKIRVPSSEFESFMVSLAALGIVLDKSIETKDVTAEIADYGAVIKTYLAKEESLRETMRASRNSDEIARIQGQLTEIRTQIDRVTAQNKALSALAELSTIEVTLTQQDNTAMSPTDPDWFGQTVATATSSFMSVFRVVAMFVTWLVVFSPLWLVVTIVSLVIYRRTSRKPPVVVH